ncbi:MAG: pilus assembly protein PilF, partial [Gammaproteobacteria bacterium]
MIPLSLTRPAVAAALLLAITVLCYLPGLPGGFLFDDFPNIVNNDRLLITDLSLTSLVQAAQSGISGANGRPLSMLSLGINHALFGVNPGAFKAVNLGIHLIGGILVLLLARRLLQLSHSQYEPAWRDRVSLFIAAIWLLHPIQLTANLYVVQRMASLASVLLLLSLLIYVIGRQRQMQDQRGGAALILAALFLVTPLAFLAKENGAL